MNTEVKNMSEEVKETVVTPEKEITTVTFAGKNGSIVVNFEFTEETGQLDYNVDTSKMNENDKLTVFMADTFMGMLTKMDNNGEEDEEATDVAKPTADPRESVIKTKE